MVHETTNLAKWIYHNNTPIRINLGGSSKRGGGIFWSCQKIHPPHSISLALLTDSAILILSALVYAITAHDVCPHMLVSYVEYNSSMEQLSMLFQVLGVWLY